MGLLEAVTLVATKRARRGLIPLLGLTLLTAECAHAATIPPLLRTVSERDQEDAEIAIAQVRQSGQESFSDDLEAMLALTPQMLANRRHGVVLALARRAFASADQNISLAAWK